MDQVLKSTVNALICLPLFLAGLPSTPLARQATPGSRVNDTMTNADALKLVKVGVAEPKIRENIEWSKPGFDTGARGLEQLGNTGVGDEVNNEVNDSQSAPSAPGAQGRGSGPCEPPPGRGKPSGNRLKFNRLPPSRFYEFIRPDDATTYRLPPAPAADAGRRPGPTKRMRIGDVRPLTPPLRASVSGKCFDLGGGYDEILGVVSGGARQVRLRFASVSIPSGAKLFVSSMRNPEETYGPYERRGPSGDGTFWTPPIEGDGAVVEYYNPRPASGPRGRRVAFLITEVSHIP